MNVYVLQTALQMARRGVEVEIFTRATSSADQPTVRVAPGVLVRNVVAGPFEGLDKYDLPTQLCAFTAGVLRAEATHEPGYYDIVHSHYWLSGQVGWLARDRWAVPLVHTAHTLAAVKNAALANGDAPEPPLRAIGEQQVVDEADRLIVNTEHEAQQLVSLHHADPDRIDVVHPGVDLETFTPGDQRAARERARPGRRRAILALRRTHPAAEGARCAAARGRPATGSPAAGAGGRRAVRHGPCRTRHTGSAGRRTGYRRPGDVPAAAITRTTRQRVPRRRPGRGAELLRIVRPRRRRGAGLRHAGGGRGRRRPAGRGARRRHRHAGRRPRRRRLGAGDRRPGERGPDTMRTAAVEHAATFSWAHTVDGLLASYGRAISDYRARHQPPGRGTRRTGRRFSMRRGVRA